MSNTASSSSVSAAVADGTESPTIPQGESCEYMFPPGNTSCLVARSCRSCLQKSGCFIAGGGSCMAQSEIGSFRDSDYRQASKYGLVLPAARKTNATGIATQQGWSFPAFEAKYCAADDETCVRCKKANFWWSSYPDTRFCAGEDGCVCIMTCESPTYSSTCLYKELPVSWTPTSGPYIESSNLASSMLINVLLYTVPTLIIVAIYTICKRLRKRRAAAEPAETREQARQRRREERREQRESNLQQRLGVGSVSLAGWNKYRGDLIDKENLELHSTAPPFVALPETPQTAEQSQLPPVDGDRQHSSREGQV